MKSLKHFAYAFLHLFTFVITLYLYNSMSEYLTQLNRSGLWFISLIIVANALMGILHLAWFIQSINTLTELPATEGWDGD